MKGNWRIKVRLVKKSEIKSWKNAKGEGQLLNAEFIDQQGSKIQGTMFKEMVQVYEPILVVGTVYEISQGLIKKNQAKFQKDASEYCYIFDRFSKVTAVEDDIKIPGSGLIHEQMLHKLTFSSLEQIA